MISNAKENGALRAINAILFLCRSLAYETQQNQLADILDTAEYLPLLMLKDEDETETFRAQLVGLAEKYPSFALALQRFDASAD